MGLPGLLWNTSARSVTTTLAVAADGNPKFERCGNSSSFGQLDAVLRNAFQKFFHPTWLAGGVTAVTCSSGRSRIGPPDAISFPPNRLGPTTGWVRHLRTSATYASRVAADRLFRHCVANTVRNKRGGLL